MMRQLEIYGIFNRRYELKDWMGTTVRGVFGFVLRRLVCNRPNMNCMHCRNRYKCPYMLIFDTNPRLFAEMGIGYKLESITKPYVLSTLHMIDDYRFKFYLTLIGKYAKMQEHLMVQVIHRMAKLGLGRSRRNGDRRCFSVKSIRGVNFLRDMVEDIYVDGDAYIPFTDVDREVDIFEDDIIAEAEKLRSKEPSIIKIEFRTPTMIIKNGTVAKEIPFSALMKNIMRKLTFIRAYYLQKKPLDLDYVKSVAALAEKVSIDSFLVKDTWINKYSIERRKWERVGPFVKGVIFYKVPKEMYESSYATELYKLLVWGQFLHVGKMATFGAGEYVFDVF
ncbi:MAG: CRISPR system precrRNA processing endoribonuclease RAMP protein Cas6 [Candidatus Asgardarchaeia archaeon]